jgi:rRNA processing protein Gar1
VRCTCEVQAGRRLQSMCQSDVRIATLVLVVYTLQTSQCGDTSGVFGPHRERQILVSDVINCSGDVDDIVNDIAVQLCLQSAVYYKRCRQLNPTAMLAVC